MSDNKRKLTLKSCAVRGPKGYKGDKGDTGATGATGTQGPQGPTGPAGADGTNGQDGKSAYQAAVDGGYTGTEEQFNELLASFVSSTAEGLCYTANYSATVSLGVLTFTKTTRFSSISAAFAEGMEVRALVKVGNKYYYAPMTYYTYDSDAGTGKALFESDRVTLTIEHGSPSDTVAGTLTEVTT